MFISSQSIWTNARKVEGIWKFQAKGDPEVPEEHIERKHGNNFSCMKYNFNAQAYIPVACSQYIDTVCIYPAAADAMESTKPSPMTEEPEVDGPTTMVPQEVIMEENPPLLCKMCDKLCSKFEIDTITLSKKKKKNKERNNSGGEEEEENSEWLSSSIFG